MKITLYSGDRSIEYDDCDIESSFVELTFTGRCAEPGRLRSPFLKRIVTTLGYIIETEVEAPNNTSKNNLSPTEWKAVSDHLLELSEKAQQAKDRTQ